MRCFVNKISQSHSEYSLVRVLCGHRFLILAQHQKVGHDQPASATTFKRRFTGGPIEARHCAVTGFRRASDYVGVQSDLRLCRVCKSSLTRRPDNLIVIADGIANALISMCICAC